jgi:hypothetical protein
MPYPDDEILTLKSEVRNINTSLELVWKDIQSLTDKIAQLEITIGATAFTSPKDIDMILVSIEKSIVSGYDSYIVYYPTENKRPLTRLIASPKAETKFEAFLDVLHSVMEISLITGFSAKYLFKFEEAYWEFSALNDREQHKLPAFERVKTNSDIKFGIITPIELEVVRKSFQ